MHSGLILFRGPETITGQIRGPGTAFRYVPAYFNHWVTQFLYLDQSPAISAVIPHYLSIVPAIVILSRWLRNLAVCSMTA